MLTSGVWIQTLKSFSFTKIIKNLFISDGNNECVPVEIEKKNSKDLLITCCYRPPSGAIKGLNNYLENVFKKANTENVLQ